MASERDREIWDDATNAVCQAMQEQKMCNCPDGDCLAAKIDFSPEKIATATRPAPADTDTGLETVAENLARTIWGYFKGGPDAIAWFDNNNSLGGPAWLIEQCRSQAEALLAAERAKVRHWQEQYTEMHSQFIDLAKSAEADNAAQAAQIKELEQALETEKTLSRGDWACQREVDQMSIKVEALEAKLAAAEKALEPFADHANDRAVDDTGWRDRETVKIVVSIGDLRKARAVLEGNPSC